MPQASDSGIKTKFPDMNEQITIFLFMNVAMQYFERYLWEQGSYD